MNIERLQVLVADDHSVVREGIRHVLSEEHGFQVVAEAETGDQAVSIALAKQPDVVLLDITMPGESGLAVTSRLRREVPNAKVLILTMHDRGEYVLEAVRAGAHGYVLKDAGPAELREAVRSVHAGLEFFSGKVAGKMSAALRGEQARCQKADLLRTLTSREREVLALVVGGCTSKEIGGKLGISPRTVESHRESTVKKLGIRSVAQLTRFAIEVGLIKE